MQIRKQRGGKKVNLDDQAEGLIGLNEVGIHVFIELEEVRRMSETEEKRRKKKKKKERPNLVRCLHKGDTIFKVRERQSGEGKSGGLAHRGGRLDPVNPGIRDLESGGVQHNPGKLKDCLVILSPVAPAKAHHHQELILLFS